MVNTRNHNVNAENNNTANPPLTLEQVFMMQAQMLKTMQQTMANMQNAQPQAPPPPPRDRLADFQCSKPPTFSHSMEPMDADDWLKTIERKLQVAQCNNREKVLLASHQLIGCAADWWDAYVEAHEEPDTINWNEFKMSFCSHHIPQGVIKLKKEFQDLKQGSMTMSEYVTRFTQLSRYAPNDVDTDKKKQECFLNRWDDELAYALEARDFKNFQAMVNKALVLENWRGVLSNKRKQECQSQQSTNSRPRMNVNSSPARPIIHPIAQSFQPMPQPTGQGCVTPQRQMILHPNLFQTPNTRNQSAQSTPTDHTSTQDPSHKKCYNCGQKGHFTNSCPNPRSRPPLTPKATSAPPPTRNGSSTPTQAQQNSSQGRVNQVAVEEAQNATTMLPGTS
jgi:hypothetical protein